MAHPSRPHQPLSINTTASCSTGSSPSPAPPSTPQRPRALGKKSSQANLRGLFGRLRGKNSSLDFGCSGQVEGEEFEFGAGVGGPVSPPVHGQGGSGSVSRQGSGASSLRSVRDGGVGEGQQSRRSSNAGSATNSMSFPSPSFYSPPLYSLPGSPSHGSLAMGDHQREAARKAEELAAEEALLEYMNRASLSARKASLPTASLMCPVDLAGPRAPSHHRRTASTSTASTRSSLASRPRTNDSLSSYQSQVGSPATSLASSGPGSPAGKRPTFKGGVGEGTSRSPAVAGAPRAYAFI